jgi:hypothetical protein
MIKKAAEIDSLFLFTTIRLILCEISFIILPKWHNLHLVWFNNSYAANTA